MPKKFKVTEQEVAQAIQRLIESDTDVTARAVAKLVGVAASTITRNASRSLQVENGAENQGKLRAIAAANKSSREALLARIETRDQQIDVLERRVQILIASHRAMLMAVGEIGGMASWQRFFDKYEFVRQELYSLGALPDGDALAPSEES